MEVKETESDEENRVRKSERENWSREKRKIKSKWKMSLRKRLTWIFFLLSWPIGIKKTSPSAFQRRDKVRNETFWFWVSFKNDGHEHISLNLSFIEKKLDPFIIENFMLFYMLSTIKCFQWIVIIMWSIPIKIHASKHYMELLSIVKRFLWVFIEIRRDSLTKLYQFNLTNGAKTI